MTVKAKPLVWVADADDPDCIRSGEYWIYHEGLGYQAYFGSVVFGDPHKTLAAAQDAVWQHHVAYVLAAIEAPAQEPVASRAAEPVKVKPLVWVHGAGFGKQEHSYADTELGTWCMTAYSGRGGRWAYTDPCGNDSEDDWLTRDECQTAVEAAREARVLAELETDQTTLALVAAAYRDAAGVAGERCAACGAREIAGLVKEHVIRRTPADAEAHLTALLRAEYERGVREAAEKCDAVRDHDDTTEDEAIGALCCALEIRALLTQEGR